MSSRRCSRPFSTCDSRNRSPPTGSDAESLRIVECQSDPNNIKTITIKELLKNLILFQHTLDVFTELSLDMTPVPLHGASTRIRSKSFIFCIHFDHINIRYIKNVLLIIQVAYLGDLSRVQIANDRVGDSHTMEITNDRVESLSIDVVGDQTAGVAHQRRNVRGLAAWRRAHIHDLFVLLRC